jgi:orotate phosphoribosyltransferase
MIPDFSEEAAGILLDTNAVLINAREPFTYTSGKKGPVYVDCRRLISFTRARGRLMDMGAETIRAACPGAEYVAGGETAGIPYAAFLSDRLELPMLYVRKKPKGFGRMAQIEGYMEDKGKKVVIVEDVQNYGVSVKVFVDALRAADAAVEHIFVIFQHGHASSRQSMKDMGVTLHALTGWQAVLKVAKARRAFDAGTLASVESFLKNPEEWAA